jgi:CDP-4-dehydro-6-deoxyglucose reductase, E1
MIKLVSDTINREDIDSLVGWLQQDPIPRLTKGDLTLQLEEKWAEKIGTKYSVFVNSGSSSILLTLAALNESGKLKNNKIVVPAVSWATDVSSPMLLGLDPIMCDCNLEDLSCDLDELENIFKEQSPSSLILVSPLGLVPNMLKVTQLCDKYGVILLEDVCESMGSKFKDSYLGSFGFASFFSMYFGHHLSTIEGGFINTNDEDFYHMLLMMRSHGWDRDLPKWKQKELREKHDCTDFDALYNFYVPGFNLRATDLQAFIGLRSIDKLDKYVIKRKINFENYLSLIKNNKLQLLNDSNNIISNFAMPIMHEQRDSIVRDLIEADIEVRPLIAGNMASKPMWVNKYPQPSLPNAELLEKKGFYIPNHQDLTLKDIKQITDIINVYG